MFCYKCGASIPDQSTSCPQCGAMVQGAPKPAPAPSAVSSPSGGSPAPATVSPWLNVPPAQTYLGEQQTEGKAVGSLILGILSIVGLWLLAGIPAIILGHLAKGSIRNSMGRLKGDGMATAGLIMGYISVAALPMVLIVAAIAIPNLLRARMAANESAAGATLRTMNTAQITYTSNYPTAGFASSLGMLGAGDEGVDCANAANASQSHACLLDSTVGCSGTWCIKNGYRYRLTATCGPSKDTGAIVCSDYIITATPVSSNVGIKNFCTMSDAVIRSRLGQPLMDAVSAEECQTWSAL